MRNFDLEEFACNHCGELPENGMNPVLLEKLDELRDLVGYPIYVTSGYRCSYWNEQCGGVENSTHRVGAAADIYCNYKTAEELAELAVKIGFDGIGLYAGNGFVHVDCRDNGLSPAYYRWEGNTK